MTWSSTPESTPPDPPEFGSTHMIASVVLSFHGTAPELRSLWVSLESDARIRVERATVVEGLSCGLCARSSSPHGMPITGAAPRMMQSPRGDLHEESPTCVYTGCEPA